MVFIFLGGPRPRHVKLVGDAGESIAFLHDVDHCPFGDRARARCRRRGAGWGARRCGGGRRCHGWRGRRRAGGSGRGNLESPQLLCLVAGQVLNFQDHKVPAGLQVGVWIIADAPDVNGRPGSDVLPVERQPHGGGVDPRPPDVVAVTGGDQGSLVVDHGLVRGAQAADGGWGGVLLSPPPRAAHSHQDQKQYQTTGDDQRARGLGKCIPTMAVGLRGAGHPGAHPFGGQGELLLHLVPYQRNRSTRKA